MITPKQKSIKCRGFSLLELSLAIAISGVLMGGVWQISGMAERSIQANFVATQASLVSAAGQSYLISNRSAVLALVPAIGSITRIKVATSDASGNTPSLQSSGLLPSDFVNVGPYGQSFAFFVLREDGGQIGSVDADDRLVGVLLTIGGQPMDDKVGANAIAKLGASGGFAFATDNPAAPSAATTIRGTAGGWSLNLSAGNWPTAVGSLLTSGHIAVMTAMIPAGASAKTSGSSSIDDLTDGKTLTGQVFLGSGAGEAVTGGSFSTATGYQALYTATSPNAASAFGYRALYSLTTGARNYAFGAQAGATVSTASGLIAFGYNALNASDTGTEVIGIGSQAAQASTTGSNLVALGYRALAGSNTGSDNVALGAQALESNTSGTDNVAIGYQALQLNQAGQYSTAIGYRALASAINAGSSVAVGYNAGAALDAASQVAIGAQALQDTTTGTQNVAVGVSAMQRNTTGSNNIAIGYRAYDGSYFGTPTTGSNNIAIGNYTLDACTSQSDIVAIGHAAGGQTSCPQNATVIGAYALYSGLGNDTTAIGYYAWAGGGHSTVAVGAETGRASGAVAGSYDAVLGYRAMYNAAGADYTLAMGHSALYNITTGDNNVAVGYRAAYNLTTGGKITAIGYQAMYSDRTVGAQTAVGYQALYNTNGGASNTAFGSSSLYTNVSGSNNLAIGSRALYTLNVGNNNVGLGIDSLYSVWGGSGNDNVGVGYKTLYASAENAAGNTGVGYLALSNNTIGTYNTAAGSNALLNNVSGSYNTAIGVNSGPTSSGLSNTTAIGYGATVSSSNEIRLGNTSVTTISGQVAWSFPSDRRDKHDIEDSDLGLDFLMHLRPVSYRLNNGNGRLDYGFVAQEVEAALGGRQTNMIQIRPDARGSYLFRANDMLSPIVKAMQERQKEIDDLKAEIAAVKAEIDALVPEKASAP